MGTTSATTTAAPGTRRWSAARIIVTALGVWGLLTVTLVSALVIATAAPPQRAVILMADGLVVLWVLVGGLLMYRGRDRVRTWVQRLPGDWRLRFVVLATVLALIEEAITTTMTNLAPLFGVRVGQAYITASANYLDVVCCHSVVVFIPMFVCWAWMLSRRDFRPAEVFILFGLTGTLAEVQFGGVSNLLNVGFWSYVYGLMVYLPAYTSPQLPPRPRPRWWHYALAVVLPFVFVIPVAGVVGYLHPVKIHFPPIR